MKKQTSNVQPAFGRRGDLLRGRRLILNIQHLLDCHPERSEGPREIALVTPDTRKRVLHRIEIAFNRRLLTAAGGIPRPQKSRSVAEVFIGLFQLDPDSYLQRATRLPTLPTEGGTPESFRMIGPRRRPSSATRRYRGHRCAGCRVICGQSSALLIIPHHLRRRFA
jgi:hypothetical protein